MRSRSDIDYDPVLKVQSISSRYRTCKFESIMGGKYESKQITCHACDQNQNVLSIKIATQMNGSTRFIKKGTLIKIWDFRTLYFDGD